MVFDSGFIARRKGHTMLGNLTIHDVLEIAQQIERNGAAFYRKAAKSVTQDKTRRLFAELAQQELEHESVFANMKKSLGGSPQPANGGTGKTEAQPFGPKAMAGLAVFGIRPDPAEQFTGKETLAEILRSAIAKEKDSIVFYTGLKGFTSDDQHTQTIDHIIDEEMHHIYTLNQALDKAGPTAHT
jgi:rubrerythrin